MTPSGSDVNGVVSGSNGGGLAGAGVVLSNDTNTFKTLTESAAPVGGFDFGQIPPGQYVLTAEDFGYTTASAEVNVGPGQTQTVNLTLPFVGQTNQNTATIQGSVQDLFSQTPIVGATIELDGQSADVLSDDQGNYVIDDVGPGVHTVTASCPATSPPCYTIVDGNKESSSYQAASVSVSVALGALAFAPVINLPKLDTVAGQVIDNTSALAPVPNPSVYLINLATQQRYNQSSSITLSTIPTAAQGGFQIDNVPSGTYDMFVTGPTANCATSYVPSGPIQISPTLGNDLLLTGQLRPRLDVTSDFNVVTLEATTAGSPPTQVGGINVTVTDNTTGTTVESCVSPAPPKTGAQTPTVISNLIAGHSYTATFTGPGVAPPPPTQTIDFTGPPLDTTTINTELLYAFCHPRNHHPRVLVGEVDLFPASDPDHGLSTAT